LKAVPTGWPGTVNWARAGLAAAQANPIAAIIRRISTSPSVWIGA
jgi:hypothetical protein